MTPEDALHVADEVLRLHHGSCLSDIQRLILQESLAGKGYEKMEGYSAQYLKTQGGELWQALSVALGEKVSKTNFKTALERRWRQGEFQPTKPEVRVYSSEIWVERTQMVGVVQTQTVEYLLSRLQDSTRLVWITGLSGIGKTMLGECLACRAWEHSPDFQWIYLELLEGQSTDFASVAVRLLDELGDRNLDPQQQNNPDWIAQRLLQFLKTRSYWIQLDALERLLTSDAPHYFVDPYWTTFFQRCLTEASVVSRFVLTSQAFPTPLVEFGDRYPKVWTAIRLHGLSQASQHIEFFEKRGLTVSAPQRDLLARIARTYEGHPLVLQVIAEEMMQEFAGDVAQYWQAYGAEFEQVAQELQAKRLNEADYNDALDRQVRDRIRRSLAQLPADAFRLLCRSAVFRRPVPKSFWLGLITDLSVQQQKIAYRVLDDRTLVEKEKSLIRQHNLIRDIAYDLLKADHLTWEIAERQAAYLWLSAYQPAPNAYNIEKVRGYLEAFDHYYDIGDWQAAEAIAWTHMATPTKEPLWLKLGIWSCFREQVSLHSKQLEIARKKGDRQGEGAALGNLGAAYYKLGQFEKAIACHEQALVIAKEIPNRQGEGNALNNLGLDYNGLGQYKKAIDYHERALVIAQEIGDRQGEGNALGNLGIDYDGLGQYGEALNYHKQALVIARRLANKQGEGAALGNLGITYSRLGRYKRAIVYHRRCMTILRELEDRRGEGTALDNLGVAYCKLERYEEALDYHQQALVIAQEIHNRQHEGTALSNLGIAKGSLGHYEEAIAHHQQHLTIAREIGDRQGEGAALVNMGETQLKQSHYPDSLANNQAALAIFREIGDREGQAEALKNLADLHHALGEIEVARDYCQQALALATELGISLKSECETLLSELEQDHES